MASSLPVVLTSFIGRDHEVAEVTRLLSESRLLTLTGAGGVGKTRLALAVATAVADQFADDLAWVDLAPLTDPELVPTAVAVAVDMPEQPGTPILTAVYSFLSVRRCLLILDNCEHLAAACAHLAAALLHAAPGLTLLATSREPLGVAGERRWRVPSLALPPPRATPAPDELADYPAVRLFVERAAAAQPGFTVTPPMPPSCSSSASAWTASPWRWSWSPPTSICWRSTS